MADLLEHCQLDLRFWGLGCGKLASIHEWPTYGNIGPSDACNQGIHEHPRSTWLGKLSAPKDRDTRAAAD
jgi:hypothetical protein